MWHRIIDFANIGKDKWKDNYGEGTQFDLDYGKLLIIFLCVYIAIKVSQYVVYFSDICSYNIIECVLDYADMSQMNKLDGRQQLLVVTMEECGELVQSCSKLLRRQELYSDSSYVQNLKEEIGDVYTMIDLMVEWDVLSWEEIEQRRNLKRKKLSKWSELCPDVK